MSIQLVLDEHGFDKMTDCLFFEHDVILVSGPLEDYKDEYENQIKNCPKGCKISLLGWGNNVVFDNVVCPSSMHIKLRNEAELLFGYNTRLSGLITCFSDDWSLVTGSACKLTGIIVDFHREARMEIGSGTTIYGNSHISVGYQETIRLGEDCMVGEFVMLLSSDCHAIFDVTTGKRINGPGAENQKKNIIVGNHVWLGKQSSLLTGSNIGDGSIIGANCCFKGNCPNNAVVIGNPGKIIRKNVAWARDNMSQNICDCKYYSKTDG